jgi:hypothetical protein
VPVGIENRVGVQIGVKKPRAGRCRGRPEQLVDPDSILLTAPAFQELLVDPQRERRIRVPHLRHHIGGVTASRQQQADEGAPQRVWRAMTDFRDAALTQQDDELTALIIDSEDETLTLVRLYAP